MFVLWTLHDRRRPSASASPRLAPSMRSNQSCQESRPCVGLETMIAILDKAKVEVTVEELQPTVASLHPTSGCTCPVADMKKSLKKFCFAPRISTNGHEVPSLQSPVPKQGTSLSHSSPSDLEASACKPMDTVST